MRPRNLLYLGAVAGVGFWIAESWVDYTFFGAESLAAGIAPNSAAVVYLRTLICLLFFSMGVLSYGMTKRMFRTHERLHKVFNGATLGIHEMDLTGEVQSANPAAREMLGLVATESGVPVSYLDAVDPGDRQKVMEGLQEAEAGAPATVRFRGMGVAATRILSSSLAPLVSPEGDVAGVVAMTEDITEQAEARESLARFQNIVSASRDLIAYVDHTRTFLVANPALADHAGLDNELLTGRTVDEIGWRMGFGPDLDMLIRRCLEGEEVSVQRWIKGERGDRFVDIRMIPCRRGGEGIGGVVIAARDITENKVAQDQQEKLERQIRQAQKLESLGVMAGGIAHDFNNLLTGILGNARLLRDELPEGSASRGRSRSIEDSASRAAELCKQMMAYAGEETPDVRPACINSILVDMSELLEASISKKAILHRGFVDDLPEAPVDATQMRQVVMNLVTNASEALGDVPGDIRVSTGVQVCDREYLLESYWCSEAEPGKYIFIEVSDTGCGMNEETLRTLLDPFFTTKFAGRGVGMAAVLGIVKSHKGAMRIKSMEGDGTTVKILLPVPQEIDPEVVCVTDMADVWNVSGTVLVVDDEMSVQEVAKDTLHLAGLNVLTARDGQEALRIYRENADDIIAVILDQSMPVMSGDETFRALRKMDPEACVLLSSGFSQDDVADELLEQGLAGFVQKPYGPGDLLIKLREILK